MRITGGAWRGRRFDAVARSAVRPTTDRIREALFSILGDVVTGATVADLCCGSGALGLEALSRGAAHVDFVDLAPASLTTVQANLQHCGAESGRWRLHRAEATRWLDRRLQAAGQPLLVLADPPYGGPIAGRLLDLVTRAEPARLLAVVVEHAREQQPGPPLRDGLPWHLEARSYGNTTLTILRPLQAPATETDHA